MARRRNTIAQINSQGNAAAAWLKKYNPGSLPQDSEYTIGDNNNVSINDSYFDRLAGLANQPINRTAYSSRAVATNSTPVNSAIVQNQSPIKSIQSQTPINNPDNKKYWAANFQNVQPIQTQQNAQSNNNRMQSENPYSGSYFDRTKFNYPTAYQGTQLQIGNQTFRLINYADGGHELYSPQNTVRSSGSGFNAKSVMNEMKAMGVNLNTAQGQQQYQAYMDALNSGPTRRGIQNQNPAPTANTSLTNTGSQSPFIQSTNLGSQNRNAQLNTTPTMPAIANVAAQQSPMSQNNLSISRLRHYPHLVLPRLSVPVHTVYQP